MGDRIDHIVAVLCFVTTWTLLLNRVGYEFSLFFFPCPVSILLIFSILMGNFGEIKLRSMEEGGLFLHKSNYEIDLSTLNILSFLF